MVSEKIFDVVAMGEILIDFTFQGYNSDGQRLFAQNAGGAPANVLVSIQKLGGKTAFLGKIGDDMHGSFLKETLDSEKNQHRRINHRRKIFHDFSVRKSFKQR